MADCCDQADDQQQAHLDIAIKRAKDAVVSIEGDGVCLSCGHEVDAVFIHGKALVPRWCCIECRDVWDKQ